jgi:hypothetical protein
MFFCIVCSCALNDDVASRAPWPPQISSHP